MSAFEDYLQQKMDEESAGAQAAKEAAEKKKAQEQAEEQARQEAAEAEANKSWFEKAGDEVSNTAQWAWNGISGAAETAYDVASETAGEVAAGYQQASEGWNRVMDAERDLTAAYNQSAVEQANATGDFSAQSEAITSAQEDAAAYREGLSNFAGSFTRPTRQAIGEAVDTYAEGGSDAAQDFRASQTYLDYFASDETKLKRAREIEAETGIPVDSFLQDDTAYKEALKVYDYTKKAKNALGDNFSMDAVWQEYPELWDVAYMSASDAALALHRMDEVRETHGIVESFKTMLEYGNLQLEFNNLQYKIMNGTATDDDRKRSMELREELSKQKWQKELPSFFDEPLVAMVGGIAGSAPEMLQSFQMAGEEAAPVMLASMWAGAGAGSVLPGVGTAAGAAAGGAVGLARFGWLLLSNLSKIGSAENAALSLGKAAARFGMLEGMRRPETGARYSEYRQMTDEKGNPILSPEAARDYATVGGALNAGIEMANFGIAKRALLGRPHASKMVGDIVDSVKARAGAVESARMFARDRGLDVLKVAGSESAEEGLQSVSDDAVHNQIAYDTGESSIGVYSMKDIAVRGLKASAEALPASLGFGLLSGAGGTVTGGIGRAAAIRHEAAFEARYGKEAQQTMLGTAMFERIQNALHSSKLKQDAPEVQQKILRSQLKGTGFETVYVDVETALEKENGHKDLQAVAKAAGMTDEELAQAEEQKGTITVAGEQFAQAESSPELLESVSFQPEHESLARMKKNASDTMKAVQERNERFARQQESLQKGILDTYAPDDGTTEAREKRDALAAVLAVNPANPADGWKKVRNEYQAQLDEILKPALDALQAGMGRGGQTMEVRDENGNASYVRFTENSPWYQKFYAEHKRAPRADELEDMAIRMVTGDASAPQVEGWVATDAETQAAMAEAKPQIEAIQKNLHTLDSIKSTARSLNGAEMSLTQGMSGEAFQVYKALTRDLEKAPAKQAQAARMSAILFARHADIFAKKWAERQGKGYTAADYYRERFGIDLTGKYAPGKGYAQPVTELDMELDKKIPVLDLDAMENSLRGKSAKEVLTYIKENLPKESIPTADFKAMIGVPKDSYGKTHLVYNKSARTEENRKATGAVLTNLESVIRHAYLVEVVPNEKVAETKGMTKAKRKVQNRKNKIDEFYRLIVPVRMDGEQKTLVIVAENVHGKTKINEGETSLYEIYAAKKENHSVRLSDNKLSDIRATKNGSPSAISIRDALRGVKDYLKQPYVDENGQANYGLYMKDGAMFFDKEQAEQYKQMAGASAAAALGMSDSLWNAMNLEDGGAKPEEIWDKTGWMRGKDGKWRFEIPDNLDKMDFGDAKGEKQLSDIYDNEKLYQAYPWMRWTPVEFVENADDYKGQTLHNGSYEVITINTRYLKEHGAEETKKTLVHEIQHVIQAAEGFATGATPKSAARMVEELPEGEAKERLRKNGVYAYFDVAGEQEARATEERAGEWTDYERGEREQEKLRTEYERIKDADGVTEETRKKLEEYQRLAENEDRLTDAESKRFDELYEELHALDTDSAEGKAVAAQDELNDHAFTKAEKPEGMPRVHGETAIISFDGKTASRVVLPEQYRQMAGLIGSNNDGSQASGLMWDAMQMERAGASKEEIWEKTGWTKGEDGAWRYEIPDNLDKIDFGDAKGEKLLGDVYDNEALYRAYPELLNTRVVFEKLGNGVRGDATSDGVLHLDAEQAKKDGKDLKLTLVHEIQHMIQDKEGFSNGGTLSYARELVEHMPEGELKDRLMKQTDETLYRNLAGEQEARNTENRAEEQTKLARLREKAAQDVKDARKAYDDLKQSGEVSNEDRALMERVVEIAERSGHTDADMDTIDQLAEAWDREYKEHGESVRERAFEACNRLSDAIRYKRRENKRRLDVPDVHDKGAIVTYYGKEVARVVAPESYAQVENGGGELSEEQQKLEHPEHPIRVETKTIAGASGKEALKKALEWFKSAFPNGAVVDTKVGNVHINRAGIKDSLSHGFSQKKLDAVPTLVDGMKQAAYITSMKDFDNKRITNHFFAYKANIGGEENYVLCRVREQNGYRKLYVHEVATKEEIAKKSDSLHTRADGKSRETPRGIALYNAILRDFVPGVNKENAGMYQRVNGGTRVNKGMITPLSDGRRIITILEQADQSTFVHEMGHLFLMDLEDLARVDDVSAKELAIVDDWASWKKGAAKEYQNTPWAREFNTREKNIIAAEEAGDFDTADRLKREWRQEHFARAFETYLREGKAPAKGLKQVFKAFKSWLRIVYEKFVGDGGRPSDAVRRVMDRMIATEEEIDDMALDDRFRDVEKAGGEKLLSESEQETYKRWQETAREDAKAQLRKLVMRDLEKKKQEAFDERVAREEQNFRKSLEQEPFYLAQKALELTGDKGAVLSWYDSIEAYEKDAAAMPPLEEALRDYMDAYKKDLDKELIESYLTEEAVTQAMESSEAHAKLEGLVATALAKKAGLINKINAKADRAMMSIEDKLTALPEDVEIKLEKDKAPVKRLMKAINELRFSTRWDAKDYAVIERMVKAATKGEIQAALKEIKERERDDKQTEKAVLEATKGRLATFHKMAQESIQKMELADAINVRKYRQQEKQAARRVNQMIRAKKWGVAVRMQEQRTMSAELARAAEQQRKEVEAKLNRVQKQLTVKTVKLPRDEKYWHQHLAFLLRIAKEDAEKPLPRDIKDERGNVVGKEEPKGLVELFNELESGLDIEKSEGLTDFLASVATAGENFRGWQSLKRAEFDMAIDALTMLYTVGRDKFKMKTIGGKTISEVLDEIMADEGDAAFMSVNRKRVNDSTGGLGYNDWLGRVPGVGMALARQGQGYLSAILKPEEILQALGKTAHKYIYGIYYKAITREAERVEQAVKDLRQLRAAYTHDEVLGWKKKQYEIETADGKEMFSKENVLAMALNMGNKKNLQRLVAGLGMTEDEVRKFVYDHMEEKDWTFVQNTWDYLATYWPETVRVEEQLNGTTLKPVELAPFDVPLENGKVLHMKGGYYHIKYNPEKSIKAMNNEENAFAESMMSGARVLGTRRGQLKQRAQYVARPLLLELHVLPDQLQDTIHNIEVRIPARDVYRLVYSKAMEDKVTSTMGTDYYKILTEWVTDVWNIVPTETNQATTKLNRIFSYLRRNSVMAIMGYRLWPVIENASNIGPVMDKLGATHALGAIANFYSNFAENKDLLYKSVFMRNRINSMDRDIRQQEGLFEADYRPFEIIRGHAYDLMLYSDLALSAPLWVQSFKDAFSNKLKEVTEERDERVRTLEEARARVDAANAAIVDAQVAAGEARERARAEAAQAAALADAAYTRAGTEQALFQENAQAGGSPFDVKRQGEAKGTSLQQETEEPAIETEQEPKSMKELYRDLHEAEDAFAKAQEAEILDDSEVVKEAERRSIATADAAIRDTFGSGRTMDLASIQRQKSEAMKLMTVFYSFFNTQFNALFSAYRHGKYSGRTEGTIRRWAPFARSVMYRVVVMSLVGCLLKFALGLDGNDDKDKYRKVKNPETGKEEQQEIPPLERFLKVFGKNTLSQVTGSFVLVRDIANTAINLAFDGTTYGRSMNPMESAFRSLEEAGKAIVLLSKKGEKDLELEEKHAKEQQEQDEKLKKLKGKKRQEYLQKLEEDAKYKKPDQRVTYSEALRHGVNAVSTLSAGRTGLTNTVVDAITGTMQYLNDADDRYDKSWRQIFWSALFDKKPVEREIPKRPPAPPKKEKKDKK